MPAAARLGTEISGRMRESSENIVAERARGAKPSGGRGEWLLRQCLRYGAAASALLSGDIFIKSIKCPQ